MAKPILSSEEAPVSPLALRESEKDFMERPDSCMSTSELYKRFVLDGSFGKTSQERSRHRVGKISDVCSVPWMRSGMVWHGEYWTHAFSESPKDAAESTLSDILEIDVPQKYFLSAKACAGILKRVAKYGRPLPEEMKQVLQVQAICSM